MRRFGLVVASLAWLAACSGAPNAPDGPVDARLELAPGETAAVAGAGVRLRFQGVMGDSRCPGDALCITGGDAIVRIDVLPDAGANATLDLHTGSMAPVRHDTLTIALVELRPYPFGSLPPIQPSDYRAKIHVTR